KAKEDRFKEISTAYDIVGDPDKRARYDTMRKQGAWGGFGGGGPGPGAGPGGPGGGGGAPIDLEQIFAQMFGGAGMGGGGAPGGGQVRYRVYSTPGAGGSFESFFAGGAPFGGESPFEQEQPPRRQRKRGRP